MAFINEDQPIQTFFADGSHPTFGDSVRIGRFKGESDDLQPGRLKHRVKALGELGIVVVDQEPHRALATVELPGHLSGLLGHPGGIGMRRAAGQINSPGRVFDEEQDVEGLPGECVHGQKIAGQELLDRDRSGAGAIPWRWSTVRMVVGLTRKPTLRSSPFNLS